MKKSLVVISGCDGFIGRNLVSSLTQEGAGILGLDVKVKSKYHAGNFRFLELDVLSPKEIIQLKRYIENKNIYLVHLVGISDVSACQQSEERAYNLNVLSLIKICKFFRDYEVKKIIFASTGLVYGTAYRGSITEGFSPHPENVYARTKLAAEEFLVSYAHRHRILAVILRLSNVYGAGMKGNTLIPTILRQLNNGKLVLRDYSSIRDYLYIKDAVKAFKIALFHNHHFNIYNVSTSSGYAVYELARIIARICKKESRIPKKELSYGRIGKLVMSNARIKKDLGWVPAYDLSRGIKEMFIHSQRRGEI